MSVIAYFGTGLLGSGFVEAMLARGETVNVWNRTAEKAKPLEAHGARLFTDPAEAVKGASQIHLTLSDDAAVDAVLEPLAGAIAKDTVILDHTTTAPSKTAERVKRWAERGITFVHTPVFMGPANARASTGMMLLSGPADVRAKVRPLIEPLSGKIVEFGDDPSRAAAFKLFGNMMVLTTNGALADMYNLGRAVGVDPAQAYTLFVEWSPAGTIATRGKAMAEGDYNPTFEVTMARKDLRLMIEEAALAGTTLDVVPAVAAQFDRAIAAGDGALDVGVIAKPR